jgi:glycosyltransferase involved in cell wall biosynthesis
MKILLVASKYLPEYTGAAFRIHRLYQALLRQNPDWSVEVLCGGIERNERSDDIIDGIRIHHIKSHSASSQGRVGHVAGEWMDAIEAFSFLRSRKFDLVHTVGTSPVVAAGIASARRRGVPLLIELVTDGAAPDQGFPILRRFHRPDVHERAAIVAISRPLAEACRRRGYSRNLWERPNPVDTGRFFPDRNAKDRLRSALTPFSGADVVLLSVAKFMAQKNQAFLLDVLAQLDNRFKLVLAGPLVQSGALKERDHAYYRQLKDKIERLGLASRVHMVPEFVDAAALIKASDAFLMPSLQEGLGTPILEARACAVPVTANAGVPAFVPHIDHGKTGYLVSLDARKWAAAVQQVLLLEETTLNTAAADTARLHSETSVQERYAILLRHLSGMKRRETIDIGALFASQAVNGQAA